MNKETGNNIHKTMNNPSDHEKPKLVVSFFLATVFIVVLWLVRLFESYTGIDLALYGIRPRQISGLFGILFAPFIHADFSHLISNTFTLYILLFTLFYVYPHSSFRVLLIVYVAGGFAVWLIARPAFHVGASGLIYGLLGFFFFAGFLRRDVKSIALSLLVTFLYGGLVWGVLPTDPKVSFESHLAGALVGVLCAFIYRNKDPLPPKYEWEDEEDEDDGYEYPEQDIDPDRIKERYDPDFDEEEDYKAPFRKP